MDLFSGAEDQPPRFWRKEDFFSSQGSKSDASVSGQRSQAEPAPAPAAGSPGVFTVTQLVRLIKLTLNQHLPGELVLQGELSNCTIHSSGHAYMTIKDKDAQIGAVIWKRTIDKLKFKLVDGLAVTATGHVDVYEQSGRVQFYVKKIAPAGTGTLELAFRQLAQRLRAEGLFDPGHKKPLPAYPQTIGIVTSPTGAAVRDIENTLNRRFPAVRKLLVPVSVQGDKAAGEIAGAIRQFNRGRAQWGKIDLIIVGRGGGSLEDLWAFNEEIVARAIYDSVIPIIAGVGHEVDVTIADMVADERAATPTAAAERAVPDRAELARHLQQKQQRLARGSGLLIERNRENLKQIESRRIFQSPVELLRTPRQRLDEKTAELHRCFSEQISRARQRLSRCREMIARIEPSRSAAAGWERVGRADRQLLSLISSALRKQRQRLSLLQVRFSGADPSKRVRGHYTDLEHTLSRLGQIPRHHYQLADQRLSAYQKRLENLNPRAVLKRGYSITRLEDTGQIVRSAGQVRPGAILATEVSDQETIRSKVVDSDAGDK